MAAAVVGRRSEGHAGCQLNGCCVRHRKLNSQSWTGALFIRASTQAAALKGQELSFVCGFHLHVCVCVYDAPVQWRPFKSGPSVCSSSRQQVEGCKQPRPHANSLSTKLAVPDSNTPSSRRTFLRHCGRAGGSGRAGMLPSHYWTERDSMWRHRWDKSLT